MAELLGEAVIKIIVDASKVTPELDAVKDKVTRSMDQADTAIKRLQRSMNSIGASLNQKIQFSGMSDLERQLSTIKMKAAETSQAIKNIFAGQVATSRWQGVDLTDIRKNYIETLALTKELQEAERSSTIGKAREEATKVNNRLIAEQEALMSKARVSIGKTSTAFDDFSKKTKLDLSSMTDFDRKLANINTKAAETKRGLTEMYNASMSSAKAAGADVTGLTASYKEAMKWAEQTRKVEWGRAYAENAKSVKVAQDQIRESINKTSESFRGITADFNRKAEFSGMNAMEKQLATIKFGAIETKKEIKSIFAEQVKMAKPLGLDIAPMRTNYIEALRAVEKGSQAAQKGLKSAEKEADSFNRTLERLQRTFLAFVAMWVLTKVVSGLRDLVAGGLAFNRTMEDSKLGIGTLFVATQNFTDIAGKALQGERLWSAAMKESGEVQTQLQMANLKTAATYEQLMRAYQMALPLGTAGGFNKEEVLNFSTAVVQAATAMMIPLDQLGEEIRSVLSGSMTDMHTRLKPLLTAMGIGNKEIKEAIAQGRLYEVVMKALSPAIQGADLAMNTFSTRLSNLKDAFSQVLGAAFKGSFDALKQSFLDITNSLVQIKEVGGKMTFKLNEGAVASFRLLDSAVKSVVVNLTKAGVAIDKFREQHPVLMGFITLFGSWILQIGLAIASVQLLSKVGKLLFLSFEWIFRGGLVAAFTKMLGPIAAAIGLWGALAIAIAAVGVAIFALNWDEWIAKQKVAGIALSDWLEVLKQDFNIAWAHITAGFAELWISVQESFPTFAAQIEEDIKSFKLLWDSFKSGASSAIDWAINRLIDLGRIAKAIFLDMAAAELPPGLAQPAPTSASARTSLATMDREADDQAKKTESRERKIADVRKQLAKEVANAEAIKYNLTVTRPAQRIGYPTKSEDAWKVLPTTPVPYESAGGKYIREVNEEGQRGPTKDAMYQVAPRRKAPDSTGGKGAGGAGPIGVSDINQFLDQMEKKTITMYRELGDANYEFWANVKKDAGDSLGAAELEISKWAEHQRSEIWQQVVDSENKLRELTEKTQTKRGATPEALAIIAKAEAQVAEQRTIANDKYTNMLDEQARRYRDLEKIRIQELVDIAQLKVSYEELTGTTETLAIAQMKLIELQAQLNKVGKSPAQQELISKNASVEATRKQIEASGTFLEGMSVGYQEWQMTITTAGQAGKQAFEVLAESMNGAADALTEFTMTGKMSFSDFANSMIRDIMRIMYKMAMMKMVEGIVGMIGSAAGGAAGSMGSMDTTMASMQSYNVAGSAPAFSMKPVMHSGGVAGIASETMRSLPRFHSGLSSDEYPAILQRGETILPKGYHDKSSSKSGPEVQVIINNKTGKDVKHKETEPRFDGKRWVKEVVLELHQTDPSFRNQMGR